MTISRLDVWKYRIDTSTAVRAHTRSYRRLIEGPECHDDQRPANLAIAAMAQPGLIEWLWTGIDRLRKATEPRPDKQADLLSHGGNTR